MMVLKLPDLLHRSGMEAVALDFAVGHVAGWVALRQLVFEGEGIDLPQRLEEAVGGLGAVGHFVAHTADVPEPSRMRNVGIGVRCLSSTVNRHRDCGRSDPHQG